MKNVFGNNVSITVFGESHGPAIGVVIDGLAPGLTVDTDYINKLLTLRRPSGAISTPRQEQDEFVIESGVFIKITHILPYSKMIYTQTLTSPLARFFGLKAVTLKAARSQLLIPEVPEEEAEKFTTVLAENGQ